MEEFWLRNNDTLEEKILNEKLIVNSKIIKKLSLENISIQNKLFVIQYNRDHNNIGIIKNE